jgi:hypothetical protein
MRGSTLLNSQPYISSILPPCPCGLRPAVPHYWEARWGSRAAPIIIAAEEGAGSVAITAPLNVFDVRCARGPRQRGRGRREQGCPPYPTNKHSPPHSHPPTTSITHHLPPAPPPPPPPPTHPPLFPHCHHHQAPPPCGPHHPLAGGPLPLRALHQPAAAQRRGCVAGLGSAAARRAAQPKPQTP